MNMTIKRKNISRLTGKPQPRIILAIHIFSLLNPQRKYFGKLYKVFYIE